MMKVIIVNNVPYITIDDKINMGFFEKQKSALIIEGKGDYDIYSRLLLRTTINEEFDIVIGESKSNILAHHDSNILNFSYIMLLDADYDHFKDSCRSDPQIIYTHFYTMENYLTTSDVVKETIHDFQNRGNLSVNEKLILEETIDSLMPLIVACNMKLNLSWNIKIEDHKIYRWWDENNLKINIDKLKRYIIDELKKQGQNVDNSDFERLYSDTFEMIQEYPLDKIDCIIHGKRKFEVLYCFFKHYFSMAFKNRNEHIFKFDLLKNIFKSSFAIELLNQIDKKMKEISA